jgi:hypothetical protein
VEGAGFEDKMGIIDRREKIVLPFTGKPERLSYNKSRSHLIKPLEYASGGVR